MSHLHRLAVASLLPLLCLAGCQFPYPWELEPPDVQASIRNQACGQTLTGAMEWNRLDVSYPSQWNELCATRWQLEGELTESYDHDACYNCRCTYEIVAAVDSAGCDWLAEGDETEFLLGLTPTANGPEDYQGQAGDWPWLGYTDFSPSGDELQFIWLGREDEDALLGSFDAGELYLYSYWYWNMEDDGYKMKLQGWIGMSN